MNTVSLIVLVCLGVSVYTYFKTQRAEKAELKKNELNRNPINGQYLKRGQKIVLNWIVDPYVINRFS